MEIYEAYKRADMMDYAKISKENPVKDEIDPEILREYAEIIFNIIMQLSGHKVDYVVSNITREGIEKNKKMWEKAAEELNERRIMERKRKIAEKFQKMVAYQNANALYMSAPGCCE